MQKDVTDVFMLEFSIIYDKMLCVWVGGVNHTPLTGRENSDLISAESIYVTDVFMLEFSITYDKTQNSPMIHIVT